MTTEVKLSNLVAPAFKDAFLDIEEHGHASYWFQGGRNTTKSTVISISIIYLMLKHPYANAVILRKVAATLRHTVYAQIKKAVAMMGVGHIFRASLSPLGFTNTRTGQQILFLGADDEAKVRGLTFATGYGAIVWFEEAQNFASAEEVRSLLNTVRRGGELFWVFYSFNPPNTPWAWINKEAVLRQQRPDTLVHHSTYLDIIPDRSHWIGQPFIDEAEQLKRDNLRAYEWEMLGKVTGTGGAVFENLVAREVDDAEIYSFDRIKNGVDFGWFPDPWAMVRLEYQPQHKRVIIFEEHMANKMLPEQTGEVVKAALTYKTKPTDDKPAYHHEAVWCDDTADGKAQMALYRRRLGLNARPAPKGNMRRQSYCWLAGLREIVLDPARCPNAWQEFSLCEFKRDRQGNWVDDFTDGNDHLIDAVRYAMMDTIVRSR